MTCCLFSTMHLPEIMLDYCYLDYLEHISVKFESKYNNCHSKIWIWKFLQNLSQPQQTLFIYVKTSQNASQDNKNKKNYVYIHFSSQPQLQLIDEKTKIPILFNIISHCVFGAGFRESFPSKARSPKAKINENPMIHNTIIPSDFLPRYDYAWFDQINTVVLT